MYTLLLRPSDVSNLALGLLYLATLGCLLSVRGKSRATRWLATTFAGLGLVFLLGVTFVVTLRVTSTDSRPRTSDTTPA